MPKGLKAKANKTKKQKVDTDIKKGPLVLREDLEQYAKVIKLYGDKKVQVMFPDQETVMARIPGRFKKKIMVQVQDVVLVSKRDFQENMADILTKYSPSEIRELYRLKEIPLFFMDKDTTDMDKDRDTGIEIEEVRDDSDNDDSVDKDDIDDFW